MNTLIVGIDAAGVHRPVRVKEDGTLDVGLTFSGTVSIGTVGFDQATLHANEVVVKTSALPAGAATEAALQSILAKLIAAPATAAAQSTANGSLASIDAKVATETTLAEILAKLIAAPATEATLASILAKLVAVNTGAVVVSSGNITANAPSGTLANSTAYEASRVVSAAGCKLMTVSGYNAGPAQFIQIHNAGSLPANGVAPVRLIGVPAQSSFSMEFENVGLPLSTGCVICNSSTGPTKTIGSADCYFTAVFI